MPTTCLAPIVINFPSLQSHCCGTRTSWPKSTSEDLKFLFSCGDQKKKKKPPVEVGGNLDLSLSEGSDFSLSTLALRLQTM